MQLGTYDRTFVVAGSHIRFAVQYRPSEKLADDLLRNDSHLNSCGSASLPWTTAPWVLGAKPCRFCLDQTFLPKHAGIANGRPKVTASSQ